MTGGEGARKAGLGLSLGGERYELGRIVTEGRRDYFSDHVN